MAIDSALLEVDPATSEATPGIGNYGDEAEVAQVQASAKLFGDLLEMLNNPDFNDIVFLCNDGQEVRASRLLLAARSDVLKGMLTSDMAESTLSQIALPVMSSPVLLSVFEYFYTGTLKEYYPQTCTMACELIVASRYFLESNLEKMAWKVMQTITRGVAQDLPKAASLLTEAVQSKSLCYDMDPNLMELVSILRSNWTDPIFVRSLSDESFHYLLEKTNESFVDDDKLGFTEYLRCRQVIWYCIAKNEQELAIEEHLNLIVPHEILASSLCHASNPQKVSIDWSPFEKEEIRNLAISLTTNIDLRQIHPMLVFTVLEPLRIISSVEIVEAFTFHAIRRKVILKTLEWHHGESYIMLHQGLLIIKYCCRIGVAVSKTPIARSYGIYEWRYTIESCPDTFCEFGFIYHDSGMGIKLCGMRLSDHENARVLNFCKSWEEENFGDIGAEVNCQGPEGRGWEKLLEGHTFQQFTAHFTLNVSENTCSLSIDGKNVGVVWNNLPAADWSLAVSLGNSSIGIARIDVLGGFDIL